MSWGRRVPRMPPTAGVCSLTQLNSERGEDRLESTQSFLERKEQHGMEKEEWVDVCIWDKREVFHTVSWAGTYCLNFERKSTFLDDFWKSVCWWLPTIWFHSEQDTYKSLLHMKHIKVKTVFLFLSWHVEPMFKHLLTLGFPPVVVLMHNIQMKPQPGHYFLFQHLAIRHVNQGFNYL